MDINLTLLGEILTFAVLVFVTLKYIWPPLSKAMEERQEKIASGLAAAERGQHDLEIAQKKSAEMLTTAHKNAKVILTQAEKEKINILEIAKENAEKEGSKILSAAQGNIDKEKFIAREAVKKHLAALVMEATTKILEEKIDEKANNRLVDKFIEELEKTS